MTIKKIALAIGAYLLLDNVRVGLQNLQLKKLAAIHQDNAKLFEELFIAASKYVPDEKADAMIAEGEFILVTHGIAISKK